LEEIIQILPKSAIKKVPRWMATFNGVQIKKQLRAKEVDKVSN
jgi:hypothetical protein